MARYFIEAKVGIGEDAVWAKQSEKATKTEATAAKAIGERVHICFHDEAKFKPCMIINGDKF